MTKTRRWCMASTALSILLATPAVAQEAASTDTVSSSDIVVTAQKREERLLDVPVAVTAVSAASLVSQNLVTITDFYDRVPGLQFGGQPGQNRTSDLSLRGVTSGGGTNPTLAILVNDVQIGASTYLGQPPIPDFDPATLERVEVLRGPQGTLYGASSLGGLIKYVLREPDAEKTFGRVEVGGNTAKGGNWGYSARGTINLPIAQDVVALRVSGFYRQDPRYIDNVGTTPVSRNVNEIETYGGLASLLLTLSDSFSVNLSAMRQYQNTRDDNIIEVVSETNFAQLSGLSRDTIDVLPGSGKRRFELYSGRATLDLGWGELTSITAFSKSRSVDNQDLTTIFGPPLLGVAYPTAPAGSTIGIANGDRLKKFSQEVRLAGSGPIIDWIGGLFYTRERASIEQTLFLIDPSGNDLATPYSGIGPSIYKEYAAFADATWHVTDKFDVQVGGRYSENKQSYTNATLIDTPAQVIFGPPSSLTSGSKEDAFTWLISPSYRFSGDMMAYIRIASGYRPGGPNTNLPSIPPTFDSDSVINYEIGFKGRVLPELTLNLAAFRIDWKDIQLQNADAISQFVFFSNGGKARSQGIEFGAELRPASGLTITTDLTYTDAKLTQDLPTLTGATGFIGASGDRLPFVAKFTANVSADQRFELSERLNGFVGATLTHIGDRLSAFQNSAGARPRFEIPGYTTVDLRAGLDYDDVWQLSLYLRNVFNERGVVVATNRSGTSPPRVTFLRPRTFGLTLARDF